MYVCLCIYVGNAYTPALIMQILNASSNTNIAEVTMIGKAFSSPVPIYIRTYVRCTLYYVSKKNFVDDFIQAPR